jgi:hypothetical protein
LSRPFVVPGRPQDYRLAHVSSLGADLDTMAYMICTSYLRVYQPLSAFSTEERERWLNRSDEIETVDSSTTHRWLITARLPQQGSSGEEREGAFVRSVDDVVFICPWRTRLRMLVGLLAFRGSIPEEVADAFVPEVEARHAAAELAAIDGNPHMRSHILHANWHVPLRWFAAFDGTERILVEDKKGLRIRYETRISQARTRLEEALVVLERAWIDDEIVATVRELVGWLEGFSDDGLLELDYSSVAQLFEADALVEDLSAAEVGECLEALGAGDTVRAGRLFSELTERWATARGREIVN